ncbi:putative Olfactory receptor KSOR19 protein [Naja naja]|nr:putative Olfactory receptor KSOR19 protein [Naja naja]
MVPKSMVNSLMAVNSLVTLAVMLKYFSFSPSKLIIFSLPTVIAYNWYVAICCPLHYEMVMNWKACTKIMILVGITSVLYDILHTTDTFYNFLFFSCETPQLLKLPCSGFNVVEVGVLVTSVTVGFGCFVLIIVSYAMIFQALLRMPSMKGRQKVFSLVFPSYNLLYAFNNFMLGLPETSL